jgi:hypothetical protein
MKRKLELFCGLQRPPTRTHLPPRRQFELFKNLLDPYLIPDIAAMVADFARDGPLVIAKNETADGPLDVYTGRPFLRSLWTVTMDLDHIFISLTGTIHRDKHAESGQLLVPQEETATRWRSLTRKHGFRAAYESDLFVIYVYDENYIRVKMAIDPCPNPSYTQIQLPSHLKAAFLQHLRDLSRQR